jgi:stringent starvation protein B
MIRALFDWIVDNQCTPYILVDAHAEGVSVPQQYVNDEGQIVLNIAPSAVQGLVIDGEGIEFSARFGGVPTQLYIPCSGVLGVYARENGQGMIFEPEQDTTPEPPKGGPKIEVKEGRAPDGKSGASKQDKNRPSLTVVK